MKQEFINQTDKTLTFKCNHCGNITRIKPSMSAICEVCKQQFDVSISYNLNVSIQSEEYYVYMLKASIINSDDKAFEEAMDNLANIDSKNEIYLHLKKRKAIKNVEDKKNLDFIVEYLIIQNDSLSKEEKIKRIKQSPLKDEYLSALDAKEDEDIVNNLYNIEPDMNILEKKKQPLNRVGLLLAIFAAISFLFILICSSFIFRQEIKMASIIVISIVPAIFLAISLINFIKIKNLIVKILLFLVFLVLTFLIISLIISLIYGSGTLNVRLSDYLYHLRHCLEEINEGINSVYE